jgi:hypothetical protein
MCIIEDLDFFFQCCVYDFLMLRLRLRKQSSTFERMREFSARIVEYIVTLITLQFRISVCKRSNFVDEMYEVI